eukprot:CAMPEP_0116917456 /NCGR_PEP_ID=MMETSP0467-20121206/19155_1 /TAXON_ID=283647 /ORGANISM="Mesodinium pulex, Strain SPMC105" /LENGTH=81 /DNA_ID=CAMNT_0004594555 /DNA_START=859 /DNA_END=1107 /DNA_ORIENTATION=-
MSSGERTVPAKAEFWMQALSARVEVAEKAQQDPQVSCERTAPMQAAFFCLQSNVSGKLAVSMEESCYSRRTSSTIGSLLPK